MSALTSPASLRLVHASQPLREQLRCLEASSQHPDRPLDLSGLLAAFDEYEAAVLSCLPPVSDWQSNPYPTPAELLAEREQSPLYRLGWVRGYQAGQAASQRPALVDPEVLLQRVRQLLAQLQQRYGTGPLSAQAFIPAGSR